MLLAIDIGNTNIVVGIIKDDKILHEARIATDRIKTSDQYGVDIKNILSLYDIKAKEIKDCIISSVVPPVFNSVRTGVMKVIHKEPLVVGPGMRTGQNIRTDIPSQVGSDRIVVAVAALAEYQPPLALLDLGTATTIDAVGPDGTYMGGTIGPGLQVSLDALVSRTAMLPRVELQMPETVLGRNTVEQIQVGVVGGYVGNMEYLIRRTIQEMGYDNIKVIATGGLSKLIAQQTDYITHVDSGLTMEGLRLIFERNPGAKPVEIKNS